MDYIFTPILPDRMAMQSSMAFVATIYLGEIPKEKAVEPAFSEDLQRIPVYEKEPDIANEDMDDSLNEDRFLAFDTVPDVVLLFNLHYFVSIYK
jgi:hypothetical protein